MAISKNAQRVLLRAAEILKSPDAWLRGWKSHGQYSNSARVCALGALRKATVLEGFEKKNSEFDCGYGDLLEGDPAYMEAADALAKSVGVRSRGGIPGWNDHKGSGHKRVHAGFCKAVKEHVEPD